MSQSRFAAALLDPALPVPAGLTGPDGQPSARRFAVYRNNVVLSLIRALEAGFPVIRKLVGEAFFAAMAGDFARAHPPRGRILMLYGARFPAFLEGFPPVAHLPYLADVARLEQAIRESYHAADAAALPVATLQALPPDALAGARLTLAPALRVVRSRWPVHGIWRANAEEGPAPVLRAEAVAVVRPAFDPQPRLLPPGGGTVIEALRAGHSLAEATALAGPGFDLTGFLGLLLEGGAITGVSP